MFHFSRTAANRLIGRTPNSVRNRLNRSQRLILDKLEERTVPATYTVLNANDTGADSLRDILAGGKGALVAGDVINFDTTFFSTSQTISLNGQFTAIAVPLTIQPTGAAVGNVTIANVKAAGADSRIFNITGGNGTVIDGLKLTGGNLASGNNGGAITIGAATVTLNNMTITGNKSASSGGAIALSATGGNLTITGSTVSGNTATTSGGALLLPATASTTVTITNSVMSTNSAGGTGGGAVFGNSTVRLNVSGSTFTSNTTSGPGGVFGLTGNTTATVNTSSFTTNTAAATGGGAFYASTTHSITFGSDTFTNNSCGSNGGAINLGGTSSSTVSLGVFTGNRSSAFGGTIYVAAAENMTVNDSTFSNSSASSSGGTIYASASPTISINTSSISGGTSNSQGGGIYMNTSGQLNVTRSTIFNNTASTNGGGISAWTANVNVTNSTIIGNTARTGNGGGFRQGSTVANLIFRNSTIYGNSAGAVATATAGGIHVGSSGGTITLDSNIVASNTVSGVAKDMYSSTARATNNPFNHNFISSFDGSNITITGTNLGNLTGTQGSPLTALVFPLGAYGGPTQTVGLKYTFASALNAGNNTAGGTLDQRGNTRVQGGTADMGAVEGFDLFPFVDSASLTNVSTGAPNAYTFSVTYDDETGVKAASLDGSEISISNGAITFSPTLDSTSVSGNQLIANYSFTAPGGSWDVLDAGTYTVKTVAGTIDDTDGTTHTNFAEIAGTFTASFTGPHTFTVDNTGDVVNGNYSSGDFTLREAMNLANANLGGVDTISFGGAAFAGAATITLASEIPITGDVTVNGTGASSLTVSGNNAVRIFSINDTVNVATVTLNALRLASGKSGAGGGGAIHNAGGETLNIVDCVFENNNASAGNGGAIAQPGGGELSVTGSTFKGNFTSASTPGGAIDGNALATFSVSFSTFSGNTAAGSRGGAFAMVSTLSTISNSTFSGNTAANGGGISFYAGGVANVENCTISGNTATASGGGIQLQGGTATLNVRNSTITNNTATTNGGGIARTANTWDINLYSSIVYGNSNANGSNTSPDLFSALTVNADYSIIGSSAGVTTFNIFNSPAVGTNPSLTGLKNNGGPTQTHALAPGSLALDVGDNTTGFTTDQRGPGFTRTLNGLTDIGAFEGIDPAPSGNWTPIGPITTPGATPNQIVVSWADDVAVDWTSLGIDDISIKAPNGSFLTITNAVPSQMTNGTPISVTYTFTVPGGAWGNTFDSGTYTVSQVAGKVSDGTLTNAAATLGTFLVTLPGTLLVDNAVDESDGNFSAGDLSLREALLLTNGSSTADTINFAASLNGQTITLGSQLSITQPVTINGNGAASLTLTTVTANVRAFNIDMATGGDAVSISGLTINKFSVTGDGGAINVIDADLTIKGMVLSNNTASTDGGAINLESTGSKLTVENSVIANNTATGGNGGGVNFAVDTTATVKTSAIRGNIAASTGGDGGAFFVNGSATTLNIEDSTVSGNTANFSVSTAQGGGAIYWNGASTINVTNSTFSGNRTTAGGGAFHIDDNGTLNIINSTVVSNSSGSNGGGINMRLTTATITLTSSIVANNTSNATGADIFATTGLVNMEASILGKSAGAGTNIVQTGTNFLDVDPLIGALADNGGFLLPDGTKINTHASTLSSPGYNKGLNSLSLANDQRGAGFPRVSGGKPDIGAFELFSTIPYAEAIAGNVPPAGSPYIVTVTFNDETGINTGGIDSGNIRITGGAYGSPEAPSSFSITSGSNGDKTITVEYTFSAPGGSWDWFENGKYSVQMQAGEVFDTDGTPQPVPAGTIGGFTVGLALPPTLTVDKNADTDDGKYTTGELTLREAINLSNSSTSVETITFAGSLNGQTITLTSSINITDTVDVSGPGASNLTVSGGGTVRPFVVNMTVSGNSLNMSGLTVSGGNATTGTGAAMSIVDETVTLNKMLFTANTITGTGGAIGSTGTATLDISESTFSLNSASSTGGAINTAGNTAVTLSKAAEVTVRFEF